MDIYTKNIFLRTRKKGEGFTLIELLVVIAIIGLLSSVVLASLDDARKKARDAQRIADFEAVQLALQLYYDDNESMPRYSNSNCCSGDHAEKFRRMTADLVAQGYLGSVPTPPQSNSYKYYDYGPDGPQGGILVTNLESIEPTHVPPHGSCRPFFPTNWCNSNPDTPTNYYCLCNPY